jgi:hypothetical protein
MIGLVSALVCLPRAALAAGAQQPQQNQQRNFYEVLDDVLGDFEYDLKNGSVQGLKDLAIRNIAVSENVPPSFKSHLELLVTEKIIKATRAHVLQCLECRAKRTMLQGDQVVVSSPQTNPTELARVARENGIAHFMDIAFSYQPTGMILSLYITDADNDSVVWTQTYNSETSRAAAARQGIDYTDTDEIRKQTEYVPVIQYRFSVLYLSEPNIGRQTGCLGAAFRAMERYDNRKKEVGFELDYLKDSSTVVSSDTAPNLYSGFNLTMLFLHSWTSIGGEENFNRPRTSFTLGIGGTYSSGFLGGLARAEYEWRLGKHYAVTPTLGYRFKSTPFVSNTALTPVSGVEFGAGISFLF